MYDLQQTASINHAALDAQVKEAYSTYLKSNKLDLLIKFVIMISELYEILGRLDQSAAYLVKMANEIPDVNLMVAIFFERAGLFYLMQKSHRKFAFYTG